MIYLLDTNVCIKLLNNSQPEVVRRVNACDPFNIGLSDVVKAELLYGACKSLRKDDNLALLNRFFKGFDAVPFNEEAAYRFGQIRADLDCVGQPIGPLDLMIAATALANNLIVLTHNTREFSRVPNLQMEDWEMDPS